MRKGKIEVSVSLPDTRKVSPGAIQKQLEILSDDELEKELHESQQALETIESMIIKMRKSVPDAVINVKYEMLRLLDLLQAEKTKRFYTSQSKVVTSEKPHICQTTAEQIDYESEFREIIRTVTKLQGAVRALNSSKSQKSEERISKFTRVLSDYQLRLKNLYELIDSEIVKLQEDITTIN